VSHSDQSNASTYNLPFVPGKNNLDFKTISLNATNNAGNQTQYNAHSLYGHMQGMATKQGLTETSDNLPFILSRSTFSGSGQHVATWLGETNRTWEDLRHSISGIMNMNMFGLPMVGADTCGSIG
jgi:alpha-glucosidase (family GH31 glycosyl hydrolase)